MIIIFFPHLMQRVGCLVYSFVQTLCHPAVVFVGAAAPSVLDVVASGDLVPGQDEVDDPGSGGAGEEVRVVRVEPEGPQ